MSDVRIVQTQVGRVNRRCPVKLRHWYAVHGRIDVSPSPAAMLDSIHPHVSGLTHVFPIHDGGWVEGVFRLEHSPSPLVSLRRVQRDDESSLWFGDGWEAELRTWNGPNCDDVIQYLSDTRQTVTVTASGFALGPSKLARICEQLCGYLARETDGLIHVYQEGFFSQNGDSLHPFCPEHRLRTS